MWVTSSHCYVGWMLRQFWFSFPGNCFLMDSALFFLVPNRCLHRSLVAFLSLPQSLTCSLMNLPHTELGPRQIKRPFHQNICDGKASSHYELVFHSCPTWPGRPAKWGVGGVDGRTFEPWLLLKHPNPRDSILFTFLICFAFEAASHWWIGGALWLLCILKLHSPEFAPVMETCTLSFKQIKREVSQK